MNTSQEERLDLWQAPLNVDLSQNPFAVFTPEALDPRLVVSLFVHEIPEYGLIRQPGHAFLNGPRGSGKSMIFRFLEPDRQQMASGRKLKELDFYGAYIPVKRTQLNITEFGRLDKDYADAVLNEHVLVLFFIINFFRRANFTKAFNGLGNARHFRELEALHQDTCDGLLAAAGWRPSPSRRSQPNTSDAILSRLVEIFEKIHSSTMTYMRRLSLNKGGVNYDGPLLTFDDFLMPFFAGFRSLSFMPRGPIYFLIDDADKFTQVQAKIINTWVWKRVLKEISLKLSTQFLYPTFFTISDDRIDTPHDYQSIDISDVYTSEYANQYRSRVLQIVERRLKAAGIHATAYKFFPEDQNQSEKIEGIKASLKAQWSTTGRGFRARDDASRYGVSEYMKQLGGTTKSKSKFSYSGFEQLVNISSGVVRYFLDPADKMFERALMKAKSPFNEDDSELLTERVAPSKGVRTQSGAPVREISPHIQNEIIRRMSHDWYIKELARRAQDKGKRDTITMAVRYQRLKNLIDSVGSLFHVLLISDRAERRVFSLAIDGVLDGDAQAVMDLGVADGFFHRSAIGRKDNFGRSDLYVLTRRLAPYFSLDPSGFAGYFYIQPEYVTLAMTNPRKFLNWLRGRKILSEESHQLPLFLKEE